MSTFNPSKARQDWQDFKKKNPSIEKLRNYPKGIGNLLDENVKIMQLAKAAGDDFRKCMDEFVQKKFDLKKREKIYSKYNQALENVLDHFRAIGKKFEAMEDLIKSSAAKDPTLKSALTDWSLFRSKAWTPLTQHWKYVDEIQVKAMRDNNYWSRAYKEPPPEMPEKSGGVLLKEWLGRPYKRYVSKKVFDEAMKACEKHAKKEQDSIYKF